MTYNNPATEVRGCRTKKQHIVPHFYLSFFSDNPSAARSERSIWVYDKVKGEVRHDSINDVAQQRCFYDLPTAVAQAAGIANVQFMEDTFA